MASWPGEQHACALEVLSGAFAVEVVAEGDVLRVLRHVGVQAHPLYDRASFAVAFMSSGVTFSHAHGARPMRSMEYLHKIGSAFTVIPDMHALPHAPRPAVMHAPWAQSAP